MDQSDKLLWPCFLASLVINGVGILWIAHSQILDPKRQTSLPPSIERNKEVEVFRRRPTPKPPPTPRPVRPTPTPPPTPTPAPTPTPRLAFTPTPPPPAARPQVTSATPRPQTTPDTRPLMNLGLGSTSKRGEGPTLNTNEVKTDVPTGTKVATTEHVEGPKAPISAPPPPPPPTPAPPTAPPGTPAPPPPTPAPPPPTPRPVVRHVVSTPATPITGWDSIGSNFQLPEGVDPADLKRNSVTLLIETDESGSVKSVQVTRSSGNPEVDRFFQNACRRMRVKPPTVEGEPMPARFEHTFNFST